MDNTTQTGVNNVKNAYSGGASAVNGFDPTSFANSVQQGQNNLYGDNGSQANAMKGFMDSYTAAIKNNPTATDLYNQGNSIFNVQPLQQNANNLNNAVLQAPQQTLDSAKGFNYDANQVANQTNLTQGRLAPLAEAATNNANTAENNASNYVQAGLSQNATNLLPIQNEGQNLTQLWAQQATGYDQNAKNELDGLVAKMQSGVQLSQTEMQQLAALSQAEENYHSAIDSANIDANASMSNAQTGIKYAALNPGQTLVNTWTGKTQRAY